MRNKSKKNRNYEVLIRIQVFILAIVLISMNLIPVKVQAATRNVESVDFSDFQNWRSGCYNNQTGVYQGWSNRLCLNDYVTHNTDKYKVHITLNDYHMLIRELNANKTLIRSLNLENGDEYTPRKDCVYLAIGIYKATGEHNVGYKTYQNLFANGFTAELIAIKNNADVTDGNQSTTADQKDNIDSSNTIDTSGEEYFNIDTIDFNDFSNWRKGYYNHMTGLYDVSMGNRICLNRYATFSKDKYQISISDSNYHILIREMSSNMKFVKSYNLGNGESYTPSSQAVYLGISLYRTSEEHTVSYTTMKKLFADGFTIKISSNEEDSSSDNSIIIDNTTSSNEIIGSITSEQQVYNLLKQALLMNDSSSIDISSYKISLDCFYELWDKLEEDCYLEYHTYGSIYALPSLANSVVASFKLCNTDSGYFDRLPKVKNAVNSFVESVGTDMTDIEKVLLAHEYVVSHTQYSGQDKSATRAGGPLGIGYGICCGYTDAMRVLLHYVDVETEEVTSGSMNHSWLIAKIDGQWYHIDPTWDDTQKGTNEAKTHRFLVRNDTEFANIEGIKHYNWIYQGESQTAGSNKYENWFVHDVPGTMFYYKNLWYYMDKETNTIVSSDINGKYKKTVVSNPQNSTLKLINVSDEGITYSIGGTTTIQKW